MGHSNTQVYKGYCSSKNSTVAIKMVDLDKYEGKTDLVSALQQQTHPYCCVTQLSLQML